MQPASIETEVVINPFAQLLDIEQRSLRHEPSEGRSMAVGAVWSGLGFRVGDWQLAVTLEEVSEIAKVPSLTRVPGSKPWVKGVANLRGTVLTAVEFARFLGLEKRRSTMQRRLLVLRADAWTSGLVVDEVYGMRAFHEGDEVTEEEPVAPILQPYVASAYRSDESVWYVFNPSRLLNDSRFLATAV